jgi:NADH dehydrogenase FAD-containing subunit
LTIKKLVLIGTGPANLYALAAFKALPRADTDVHLIAPFDHVISPGMLSGLVAGHYSIDDCTINLPAFLGASAIKPHFTTCTSIEPRAQRLHMQQGEPLHYDVLSIDTSPVMDRDVMDARLPGAKEHALFVQPLEQFAKLWPQVLAHAQQHALNISVVGAGPVGVELAMALHYQLPHCRVTLVAQQSEAETSARTALSPSILKALKARHITVLQDSCSAIEAQCMHLSSGASLSCDMALIATGSHLPAWLAQSGLDLDAQGHVAVNSLAQSPSYPQVFVVSGLESDTTKAAGLALEHNLRATLDHLPLKNMPRTERSVNLMACGDRTAIATWGGLTLKSHWAWRCKHVIDQRWIRQYKL